MTDQEPFATFEVRAEYDPNKGELSFIDEQTTRILAIRAGFEETATRRAVIIELEQRVPGHPARRHGHRHPRAVPDEGRGGPSIRGPPFRSVRRP